ncbi:hypothetical protein [Candidatus Arthromitus sp. SFB-rat-Yit]|uniref:hypothetical protein n=1 Tax=Candidatus Arthromitus sp. SFB-rat-Yit TaxID=1041504 RepID=UPI000227A767|nr:hypothetical protein [Candidatus Arthromitus sp. SFB-rat-Yit]BAK81151.1 hypothetical protein RATSFB_0589 [Candidatus Arthromitus sp. SFB-rat-Yit]
MKRSKLLLVSAVFSTLYLIYIFSYFLNGLASSSSGAEVVGVGIASFLVAPHVFMVLLGVLFNWIGWGMNKRWAALVSGILYSVSIFFMILYGIFVIIQVILCFVGYAKMGKKG